MAIEQRNAVYAEILPARSLFIGPPEYALAQLARRESSVALPDRLSGKADPALVAMALERDVPVFMAAPEARRFLAANPGFLEKARRGPEGAELVEIGRLGEP
ncbi:MAG: hypothetical protein AAGD12_13390, partial [Pseudomonadota bacterium]